MKKSVKTVLAIIILMILSAHKADAAVLYPNTIKQKIKEEILKQVTPPQDAQLEIEIGNLPFQKLTTKTNTPHFEISLNTKVFSPKTVVLIKVIENNKTESVFGVPVCFNIFKDVLVTTESIDVGKPINGYNTEIKRLNVTSNLSNVAPASIISKEMIAKKIFRANEIIDKRFIATKPDITRESIVTILFQTGSISINLDGEAKEQGSIGDYIRVYNSQYKRYYTGKIIDAKTVLVSI